MNILGINGNTGNLDLEMCSHDCALAYIKDGKLVDIIEEERLTRIKHDPSHFPRKGFKQLLKDHSLKYSDIDYYDVHEASVLNDLRALSGKDIRECYTKPPRHHIIHAYESFYTSGFNEAAVLIIDGYGTDEEAISLIHATHDSIEILKQFNIKRSLGKLYSSCIDHCGLALNGKTSTFQGSRLMSLSGYGTDLGVRFLSVNGSDVLSINDGNHRKTYSTLYPYCKNKGHISVMHYANLAATVQATFNEVALDLVKMLKSLLPNVDNLCLSGGCIQNGIANNLICESGIFANVWASPMVADGGTCIGNAYYASTILDKNNTRSSRLTHPFFGREYGNEHVCETAEKMGLVCKPITANEVAEKIVKGCVIGWFQGKSEIGPRALGHRSILARINDRSTTDKINSKIKCREDWRPLASIFIDKVFDQVFDVKNKDLFNFMMRATKIRPDVVNEVQGASHVDRSALPQLVTQKDNPDLYELLDTLYSKYNMLGVLNTSLNDHDEPIVENPEQAMKFLIKTPDLDGIVFNGNLLVTVAK